MPFSAQPKTQFPYWTTPKSLSGAELVAQLTPLASLMGGSVLTVQALGGVFQGPWDEFQSSAQQIVDSWQLQVQLPKDGPRPQTTITWQIAFGNVTVVFREGDAAEIRKLLALIHQVIPPRQDAAAFGENPEVLSELARQFSELEDSLREGQAASQEIQAIRSQIRPRVDEIESMARTALDEERKARTSSREAAEHEATARTAMTHTTSVRNQMETLHVESKKLGEESTMVSEQIKQTERDLSELESRIQRDEKKALELLDVSTVAALNRAFESRAQAIKYWQWLWLLLIMGVNGLLAYLSYRFVSSMGHALDIAMVEQITKNVGTGTRSGLVLPEAPGWILVAKLLVGVPLIYLDYFLVTTYRQNRDLIERYEFKNAVTLTMATYQELIQREHAGGVKDSLEFVLRTTDRIYEPPLPDPGMGERERKGLLETIEKLGGAAVKAAARATTKPNFLSSKEDQAKEKE